MRPKRIEVSTINESGVVNTTKGWLLEGTEILNSRGTAYVDNKIISVRYSTVCGWYITSMEALPEALLASLVSVYDLHIAEIILYSRFQDVCSDAASYYEVDVEELEKLVIHRWDIHTR